MSLTSYRTAPPRVGALALERRWAAPGLRRNKSRGIGFLCVSLNGTGLGGPGGDLLSHALRRSTIGAEGFHGRVRDGIGCITPRHSHQAVQSRCAFGSDYCSLARPQARMTQGQSPWPARDGGRIKPIERLVPVSFTCCHASTPGLSTWWSSTALKRDLVSREASRLDAFSGYPVRT